MNHIDRLLRQARKAITPAVYCALCIIDFDGSIQKWTAVPQLWDGIPGSGFMDAAVQSDWKSEYDTAEEAVAAVNSFFATLNISDQNRVVILIDDMGA